MSRPLAASFANHKATLISYTWPDLAALFDYCISAEKTICIHQQELNDFLKTERTATLQQKNTVSWIVIYIFT